MMILFSQRRHLPTFSVLILVVASGCLGEGKVSSATPAASSGERTTLDGHEEPDQATVKEWKARLEAIDRADRERELDLAEVIERAVIHGQLLEVDGRNGNHLASAMSDFQRASAIMSVQVDQIEQYHGDQWPPLAHGLVASGFQQLTKPLVYVLAHYQRIDNVEAQQAIQRLVEFNLLQGIEHARRGYEIGTQEGFDLTRQSAVQTYVILLDKRGKFKASIGEDDSAAEVFATANRVLKQEIAAIDPIRSRPVEKHSFNFKEYHEELLHFTAIIGESQPQSVMPNTSAQPERDDSAAFDITRHHQLASAIRDGDMETVFREIDSMTNIDLQFEHGESLLGIAVETQERLAVQAICKAGADVNQVNGQGQSPLHRALNQSDFVSSSLLLKYGANCLLEDWHETTPCDQLKNISGLDFTPTADEFSLFHDSFLEKQIKLSLVQIRDRLRSSRQMIQMGQEMIMANAGGLPSMPKQQYAAVLSAPQTSGMAVVLGGSNVDSLPTTLRDEYFRRFREQRKTRIDLTPTAQETEFLRDSALETAEIWRQNGRDTIAFAQEHLRIAIEQGVYLLMCAEVRWEKGDDEYQQVCRELKNIFTGNEPPMFDPNAYRKPGFQPASDGHVIGSPSMFDW